MQATADLNMFFGRFHPLFIHLPIGLLVFAILMELLQLLSMELVFRQQGLRYLTIQH